MNIPLLTSLPPRWRKAVYWSAGLLLLYTLLGFLALPPIVRSVLARRLSLELGRSTSVRQVRINPYVLSATVRGFLVQDKDEKPLVSWEELHANFQLSSLFTRSWTFREIQLVSPYLSVRLDPDGTLNFSDLFNRTNQAPAEPEPPEPGRPRPLRVGNLRIAQGKIRFTDLAASSPFETLIGPFEVSLDQFSTASDNQNPYVFSGKTESGETFSWQGHFFLEPLRSQGTLSLAGLELARYAPYYQDHVRFQIKRGVAELHSDYSFTFSPDTKVLQLTNASLSLQSFGLAEPGASTNLVEIAEIKADAGQLDLFESKLHVGQISTRGGRLHLRRSADGQLNLTSLFAPATSPTNAPAPPPAPSTNGLPWMVNLGSFDLQDYALNFADLAVPRPVQLLLDDLKLQVRDLSTAPNTTARTTLSLRWNKTGQIQLDGTLGLVPPSGGFRLQLADIPLQPLDHYLDPFLNLLVQSGTLGLDGQLHLSLSTNTVPEAGFRGDLTVANLAVAELPSQQELIKWRNLTFRGLELASAPPAVSIDQIAWDSPSLHLYRDSTTNNLTALIKAPAAPPDRAGSSPPAETPASRLEPRLSLNGFALSHGQVRIDDQSNPRPVQLAVDDLALEVQSLSNTPGNESRVNLSLRLNTNGLVRTEGTMSLLPIGANLKLEWEKIALRPFDPYLDPFLNLIITDGTLDLAGRAKLGLPANAPPAASFQGELSLGDCATMDGVLGEDLVRWKELRLTGLDFQLEPQRVSLQELALRDFFLRLILDAKTNNLAGLVKQADSAAATAANAAAPPAAADAPAAGNGPEITLSKVALSNVNLQFSDRSVEPDVSVALQEIGGNLIGLSSVQVGAGKVSLTGRVDRAASFDIAGRTSILTRQKDTEMTIRFANVDLMPFAPYIAKYLGFQLNKGRLNFNVEGGIKGRDLNTKNLILLNQFALGEPVESPDAVKAPIKFGLAILRDPQGNIELDVPVEGNLDDPEFRYGKVVWRALVNVFLKAATSPFALLGGLVGAGSGEELSFIDFQPGSARLGSESVAKLEALAKALQKRPGLRLEISGHCQPSTDLQALRRERLTKQFRMRRFATSREGGQTVGSPEEIPFSAKDYTNAVVQAFANLSSGSPQPASGSVSTNAPQAASPAQPTPPPSPAPAPEPPPVAEAATSPPPRRRTEQLLKGGPLLFVWKSEAAEARLKPDEPAATLSAAEPPTAPSPAPLAGAAQPNEVAQTESSSPPPIPFAQMEERLLGDIGVTESDLKLLADERAGQVKRFLAEQGQITVERLFLVQDADPASGPALSRVSLQLK